MRILNISNIPLWMWGEGRGIPSVFFPQAEFAKRGHEVHFLCPLKTGEEKYAVSCGIHVYRFDFPFNFKKNIYIQTHNLWGRVRGSLLSNLNWLFFEICGFWQGLKLGLKVRPDIIYAHSLTSAFPSWIISKFLGAKFIIRVYGTRQLFWKWPDFWYRLKEFRDYLAFKIPADYFIITNDGNFGNILARKLGVKDDKIKYWPNGVEEDFFKREPDAKDEICRNLNINPAFKLIVSTCRLISDYRIDKLFIALAELFKKRNDVMCLIAGSGPEEKKLKKLAEDSGVSKKILFLGIVDRQMVRKILNAGDIFILLARYHNCTNTMWEAMACGKCIVTTETEPIKEVLASGDNAILVSPDNFKSIPEILESLLNNDDLRNKLGKRARMRAEQILEPWSKRAEKEAELLEGLIKR